MENTQITKVNPKKTIEALITGDAFRHAVSMALPKHCKPERFIRVALSAFNRTPALRQCTQESLFNCFLRLSELGIEADGRRAHLIPFRNTTTNTIECTLIIDYKGLAELVMRSGEVSFIFADVVCENDEFDYDKGQIRKHKVDWKSERGPVYAAYALARLKHEGEEACRVLSKSDIEKVRTRSKSANKGPWVTDWNEMAKKTAFRNLSKWLPLSPELHEAIEKDDDAINVESRVEKAALVGQTFLQAPANEPEPTQDEEDEPAAGLAPVQPSNAPAQPPRPIPSAETSHAIFQREILDLYKIPFDAFRQWAIGRGLCDDSAASLENIDGRKLRSLISTGRTEMLTELGVGQPKQDGELPI